MIAKDVMDSNIVTVYERATLEEIFEMTRAHKTADFVVVDSDLNYCGMLFETELLSQLYRETEKINPSSQVELRQILKDGLRQMPVCEFMNARVRAFAPTETLERMAERMLFEKVSKMAVVDYGAKVVGIVRLSTILSNLMEQFTQEGSVKPASGSVKAGSARLDAEDPKNKRFFQRVPLNVPVAYRLAQGDKYEEGKIAQTINASAGGLLILTKEKLNPGHSLHVALDLYQNNQPLRMVCRIVRCLPSKQAGYFEIGLMFLAIGVDERRRLEEHLRK